MPSKRPRTGFTAAAPSLADATLPKTEGSGLARHSEQADKTIEPNRAASSRGSQGLRRFTQQYPQVPPVPQLFQQFASHTVPSQQPPISYSNLHAPIYGDQLQDATHAKYSSLLEPPRMPESGPLSPSPFYQGPVLSALTSLVIDDAAPQPGGSSSYSET